MKPRMLVPIDGSEGSLEAARFAARLAAATGATVRLLYVYDPPAGAFMGMMRLVRAEVERAVEEMAREHLEKAKRILDDVRVPAETTHRIGHPVEEILAEIDEEGINHVVLGSRGMSRIGGLMLGGVSDRVVHRAPCPVTVVRRPPS